MSPIVQLLLLTTIAGAAMPIGGFVASFEHIRSNWLRTEFRHFVIAFGGGALFSAIALVLIPEGFNSYRELREGGLPKRRIPIWFAIAALLGPIWGTIGYWMLAGQPRILGWMQVFAASGIMYLVFEDIAPQAKLKNSSLPSLGAVLGFLLGLLGKLVGG